MRSQAPETGWELVAQRDEAPTLFRAVLELDSDVEYTRSEIADAAGVPLKTLHLADTIEDFVEIGLLDKVDSGGESSEVRFSLNPDSDVLAAARDFDEAVTGAYDCSRAP